MHWIYKKEIENIQNELNVFVCLISDDGDHDDVEYIFHEYS